FGRPAGAPLGHRVADLPEIRRDLRLLPFALVVIPFVAAADLHAGVLPAFEFLELVVRRDRVLHNRIVLWRFRRASLGIHVSPPLVPGGVASVRPPSGYCVESVDRAR